MTDLHTIKETRKAIREAKVVLMMANFGVSETWVKLRKSDAMEVVNGFADDMTPKFAEMYSGIFGTIEADGTLYLG